MPNPLERFLTDVRATRRTGQATAEQSFYPAVFALLSEVGSFGDIRRRALAHPSGVQGQFPDVAIYEVDSNVLALPVEVKGASEDMTKLARSSQALRYANTFGGGLVLLTNLREWSLAEVDDTGLLKVRSTVTVAKDEAALDAASSLDLDQLWSQLKMMVADGLGERASQGSPKLVASLLAYHARNMRDAINAAGDPQELLASLNDALSQGLHIELDDEHLTPTVVQTLVYGAFAAWLHVDNPQRFDWMQASYKLTVPVFAEILHAALRPNLLRKCDLTPHLKAVERVLRWTDQDRFTSEFDGDAVQYFYEPFLAEFDESLRDALGVWYTPREIAEYQVARAHHHVLHDLGLPEGLADETVYLLDPAVGTGTYLIAAADFLYDLHVGNGEPTPVAATKALDALLTRFIGFEILPAAFIICHLHLSRRLQQLGATLAEDQRLRVYLTNSLTGWRPESGPAGLTLFPELETELHDAAVAKQTDPVVVVLGNPPYHGYSTAESDEEREMLKPWIDELWPVWGLRKHRMNDLYVRFWRVALHRIITLTNRGVVSFITNRKWLGGRSYPSMRAAVVNGFDDVWVDDLRGDVHDRSHPGDQSIFTTSIASGIRVGTAIVTAVRRDPSATGPASVHVHNYRGSADSKRKELAARRGTDMATGFTTVAATRRTKYRLADDPGNDFASLDEYLPTFFSGVQPVRDEAVVAFDREPLETRMKEYFDSDIPWADLAIDHPGFAVRRSGYQPEPTRAALLRTVTYDSTKIVPYLYRPFDTRYLYWETEGRLLNRARPELAPYFRNVSGQTSLAASQTPRRIGAARPLASRAVACFEATDPNARIFPLYAPTTAAVPSTEGELDLEVVTATSPTTVAAEWVDAANRVLGIEDDKQAGEAIFHAIIAITHSPEWLTDQPVESDDFPAIPLPDDPDDFTAAVTVGETLLDLMDPDKAVPGVTTGRIRSNLQGIAIPDSVPGHQPLDHGTYGHLGGLRSGNDVLWSQPHGWRNVPEEVWTYTAGGFQVLGKWLSYRKRTGLSTAERDTFRILCRRIQAIIDHAVECDRLYQAASRNPLLASTEAPEDPAG